MSKMRIEADDFRELLELELETLTGSRHDMAPFKENFFKRFLYRRTLRNERVFNRTLKRVNKRFAAWRTAKGITEIGDGSLLEIFLDWLSDGGWQIIIEIIKGLLG